MANLIEEERRLEQQHFEAQLNRTAPEGAENNVLASPPSSSRRRASFSSPFMPGIVGKQFRPPIALHTDLSHITTELWEISVLCMAH